MKCIQCQREDGTHGTNLCSGGPLLDALGKINHDTIVDRYEKLCRELRAADKKVYDEIEHRIYSVLRHSRLRRSTFRVSPPRDNGWAAKR